MKKLIVLLLALTVAVGAFAQATVNGYVRAIGTYNDEAESFEIANRLRLNLSWTSEDENVEFGARIQASDWTGDATISVADYAYGKIKLADGKIVVSGGRLWNFDYDISSTGSDYAAIGNVANGGGYGAFDAVDGMLFQVLPVEGLNIGLLVTPDEADAGWQEFGVGAKYSIADIGDVVVSWKGATAFDVSALSASFAYTGMEGLFAAAGYKGLATNGVYAIVNYSTDALFVEVAPEFNFDSENFYIEAMAKYTAGDLAIAALFGYETDPALATADGAQAKLGGPDAPVGTAGNEYWVGAEVYYTVGKGQFVLCANYAEKTKFSVSPVVKVSF